MSNRLPDEQTSEIWHNREHTNSNDHSWNYLLETLGLICDAQDAYTTQRLLSMDDEKLKEEIAKTLCDFGKSCDLDAEKYHCPDPTCAIAPDVDSILEKVKLYSASQVKEALEFFQIDPKEYLRKVKEQ
jgi:hypothetical protein